MSHGIMGVETEAFVNDSQPSYMCMPGQLF